MDQIIEEIIEEFALFDHWEDKYSYIIDMGKELPLFPDEAKNADNLVKGCTSQVWLIAEIKDGKLYLKADSDAFITKGLVAILIRIYSERDLSEISNINIQELFDKIGLESYLSPSRSNGFFSMVKKIKSLIN